MTDNRQGRSEKRSAAQTDEYLSEAEPEDSLGDRREAGQYTDDRTGRDQRESHQEYGFAAHDVCDDACGQHCGREREQAGCRDPLQIDCVGAGRRGDVAEDHRDSDDRQVRGQNAEATDRDGQ